MSLCVSVQDTITSSWLKSSLTVNLQTYIFNAFLVDGLASFSSLLANHNALQQRVNNRFSKGIVKRHNLQLQRGFGVLQELLKSLNPLRVGLNQVL